MIVIASVPTKMGDVFSALIDETEQRGALNMLPTIYGNGTAA
jgi:hypothetical protein